MTAAAAAAHFSFFPYLLKTISALGNLSSTQSHPERLQQQRDLGILFLGASDPPWTENTYPAFVRGVFLLI